MFVLIYCTLFMVIAAGGTGTNDALDEQNIFLDEVLN